GLTECADLRRCFVHGRTRAAQRAELTPNAAWTRVKCARPTEYRSEAVHLAFKPRRESESKQPTDEATALVYERRQIIQNRSSQHVRQTPVHVPWNIRCPRELHAHPEGTSVVSLCSSRARYPWRLRRRPSRRRRGPRGPCCADGSRFRSVRHQSCPNHQNRH